MHRGAVVTTFAGKISDRLAGQSVEAMADPILATELRRNAR